MSLSYSDRLAKVRAFLLHHRVEGFILTRGDEHMNEYVAPYAERLAWMTGFEGSAGTAVILQDKAALFSDGRYILQMKNQTDPQLWQSYHSGEMTPALWLKNTLAGKKDISIGYDPKLISETLLKPFEDQGLHLVPLDQNPIDALWLDQPPYPHQPASIHPLDYAGMESWQKRTDIIATLHRNRADALLITDPTCMAWLVNIRGTDIPYTPIALCFGVLHATGTLDIFSAEGKFPPFIQEKLGEQIYFYKYDQLEAIMRKTLAAKRVQLDPATTSLWFIKILEDIQASLIRTADPCLLAKACKNPTEQQGARTAHFKDGLALCRFLCWLERQDHTKMTELDAAYKLNEFRKLDPDYREESFPAISAAGANGAIIHYRATTDHHAKLGKNTVFLLDSGGQYLQGTTDITRTLWLGSGPVSADIKEMATRVLKGHIALSSAKFPENSPGHRLDSFARRPLWDCLEDFDHGTGHGVGSFLSVHEGPCRISSMPSSVGLKEGMILSNEPGFYKNGAYGIRLENLVLAQKFLSLPTSSNAKRSFLYWEVLTLVPFDKKLIDETLLTTDEKEWLNLYHEQIEKTLSPSLSEEEKEWLFKACAPFI